MWPSTRLLLRALLALALSAQNQPFHNRGTSNTIVCGGSISCSSCSSSSGSVISGGAVLAAAARSRPAESLDLLAADFAKLEQQGERNVRHGRDGVQPVHPSKGGKHSPKKAEGETGGGGLGALSDLAFTIQPTEGPASGGTQITATISGNTPSMLSTIYCQFGGKTSPAQSIFILPESLSTAAVLCTTPAGPTRASVTVRLSVDGKNFVTGPRFFYSDPLQNSPPAAAAAASAGSSTVTSTITMEAGAATTSKDAAEGAT